jgi:predicted Zn-ribbon and HTH transcriptional regulator
MASMTTPLLLAYAVLWATLLRALLVRARVIPPTCPRCGYAFERSELGQQICSCG